MADIAIYALVGGITSLQERMSNFRSPVIPLSRTSTPPAPPPIPPHISRSADAQFLEGTLTEHGLELAHYSWATRHAALALRQYALKDAVQKSASSSFPSLDLHRLRNLVLMLLNFHRNRPHRLLGRPRARAARRRQPARGAARRRRGGLGRGAPPERP